MSTILHTAAFSMANLLADFQQLFAQEPLLVRSPGRVNIIGEHTDYNEGFVLPAAIDKAVYVAITAREDNEVHLYAPEFKEHYHNQLEAIAPVNNGWPNYVLGVVDEFRKAGYATKGFNLVFDGNVPVGAGLSSSAAVECAVGMALNEVFRLGIDSLSLVKMAQLAEHHYAGVMCGIMDQFASVFGKKDHVIKLDCRSLDYEYKPFLLDGYKILLLNTNVKHSLAASAYNERRHQCETGVGMVKEKYPYVNSLRDISLQQLQECVAPNDALVFDRCAFVVEEIARLQQACADLDRGDLASLGEKMFETHIGLSKQYEVSCKELDFLVEAVKDNPAVLGARMMGGGFGGCTINLVEETAIPSLVASLTEQYGTATGLQLEHYIASIEDGTAVLAHPA